MVCLAVITSEPSETSFGNGAEQVSLQVDLYREKVAQCLVSGEYTKTGPYVLEAIVHYVYIEFLLSPDAGNDLWFLLAIEVNMAMRMGYHREPSHFPGLTPLQGEMRRRLWATVLQGDILISSQMGMPRMVSVSQCDTAEPRNLNDADLTAQAIELPPSRPETEYTTSTGVIARTRLLVVLGSISDLNVRIDGCTYDEVIRVDRALLEAAATLPQPLQMKAITASITDPPHLIMSRLFLSHLMYRGQLLLHQRFLHLKSSSPNEDSYAYSRKACLNAALGSLQLQQALDEETRPGGQLDTLRWRVTSIMNHQFLTATMILCSLLHRNQTLDKKDAIVAALRGARAIWIRTSTTSREAQRATEGISFVLTKAGKANEPPICFQQQSARTVAGSMDFSLDFAPQNSLPDAATGFSPSLGGALPPFWVEFTASTRDRDTDMDIGMDTSGTGGQALYGWMEMNRPTGAI